LQGIVAELFGVSNRVLVLRKAGSLVRHSKSEEVDAGLQVK